MPTGHTAAGPLHYLAPARTFWHYGS